MSRRRTPAAPAVRASSPGPLPHGRGGHAPPSGPPPTMPPVTGLPRAASARTSALLLPPGTYWCAIARYPDRSGLLGAYGPYRSREDAEDGMTRLRDTGVHVNEQWDVQPLRAIGLGEPQEVR